MRVDVSFLPVLAAAFLLTFARVGTMVMLLPDVGELNLPSRVRLTIALVLTAILLPAHQKAYTVELTALAPLLFSSASRKLLTDVKTFCVASGLSNMVCALSETAN